jgi:hypothetical protein
MKPPGTLSITDRYRLKELELQQTGTVPPGRIMWCRDRQILGYGDVGELASVFNIRKGANTLCVSREDFSDIKEWLG